MVFFPTVPEPERAYLERTSKTESERKSSRAVEHLVRGEDDPRVEIRKAGEVEARRRILHHLGSRKEALKVAAVGDEVARARAPAGVEFRSGLFLLVIGAAIAVTSALLVVFVGGAIFYITWLIGSLIGIVGFERASERYTRHMVRFRRGEYGFAAADVMVRHERAKRRYPDYIWWMAAGALVGIPSVAFGFPLGWIAGIVLGIVGLVKVMKIHSDSLVEQARLARAEELVGSKIEVLQKPAPKLDRRVRGYHWFFVVGALIAFISALFSFYIGFFVGVLMAIGSIISDSEWL